MEKRYHYITPEDEEIAERNGINNHALRQRVMDRGWDIEKAITVPLRVEVPFQPIWEKWEALATENGVTKDRFYHRVKINKMDEELAASRPVQSGNFRSFFTKDELSKMGRLGIGRSTALNRIQVSGWSREEAVSTPVLKEWSRERDEKIEA